MALCSDCERRLRSESFARHEIGDMRLAIQFQVSRSAPGPRPSSSGFRTAASGPLPRCDGGSKWRVPDQARATRNPTPHPNPPSQLGKLLAVGLAAARLDPAYAVLLIPSIW